MFKANIRHENGMPQLYINDERTAPMLLWLNTDQRATDDLNTAQAREFGRHGLHLYSAIAELPLSGTEFDACRDAMRCIIAGDPEARILPVPPKREFRQSWLWDSRESILPKAVRYLIKRLCCNMHPYRI